MYIRILRISQNHVKSKMKNKKNIHVEPEAYQDSNNLYVHHRINNNIFAGFFFFFEIVSNRRRQRSYNTSIPT